MAFSYCIGSPIHRVVHWWARLFPSGFRGGPSCFWGGQCACIKGVRHVLSSKYAVESQGSGVHCPACYGNPWLQLALISCRHRGCLCCCVAAAAAQPSSPPPAAPVAAAAAAVVAAPVAAEQHWPTLGDSKEAPKKKKGTSTPPEQLPAAANSSKVSRAPHLQQGFKQTAGLQTHPHRSDMAMVVCYSICSQGPHWVMYQQWLQAVLLE